MVTDGPLVEGECDALYDNKSVNAGSNNLFDHPVRSPCAEFRIFCKQPRILYSIVDWNPLTSREHWVAFKFYYQFS